MWKRFIPKGCRIQEFLKAWQKQLHIFFSYGSASLNVLKEHVNEIAFSYNDIYLIQHENFRGFGEVVEVANPYAEGEFIFLKTSDFKLLLNELADGKDISALRRVTENVGFRIISWE